MIDGLGYGRRGMVFSIIGNGDNDMKEIKHKGCFFSDESYTTGAGYATLLNLEAPAAGKKNFLVGAVFHHAKAGVGYQVDYGISTDIDDSLGSILMDSVKSNSEVLVNSIQTVSTTDSSTSKIVLPLKGIVIPDDNVTYHYGQRSVGTESNILNGVDVYYVEDDE